MKRTILILVLAASSAGAADLRHLLVSKGWRRAATVSACLANSLDYGQTRYALARGYVETNAPGLTGGSGFGVVKFSLGCGMAVVGEVGPRLFRLNSKSTAQWNSIFFSVGASSAFAVLPAVVHNFREMGKQ